MPAQTPMHWEFCTKPVLFFIFTNDLVQELGLHSACSMLLVPESQMQWFGYELMMKNTCQLPHCRLLCLCSLLTAYSYGFKQIVLAISNPVWQWYATHFGWLLATLNVRRNPLRTRVTCCSIDICSCASPLGQGLRVSLIITQLCYIGLAVRKECFFIKKMKQVLQNNLLSPTKEYQIIIKVNNRQKLEIFQAFAPTSTCNDADDEKLYENIEAEMKKHKTQVSIVVGN